MECVNEGVSEKKWVNGDVKWKREVSEESVCEWKKDKYTNEGGLVEEKSK